MQQNSDIPHCFRHCIPTCSGDAANSHHLIWQNAVNSRVTVSDVLLLGSRRTACRAGFLHSHASASPITAPSRKCSWLPLWFSMAVPTKAACGNAGCCGCSLLSSEISLRCCSKPSSEEPSPRSCALAHRFSWQRTPRQHAEMLTPSAYSAQGAPINFQDSAIT